jgi:hypothetical protein
VSSCVQVVMVLQECDIFTALGVVIMAFCVVMPCCLVDGYQLFRMMSGVPLWC